MRCVVLLTLLYDVLGVSVEDLEAFQEFAAGNHKFTAAAYKEILKQEQGNFIVSPLSTEIVLALTKEGAKGKTAEEIQTGLFLPSSTERTRKALKSLLSNLKKNEEQLRILIANKIYTDKNLILEENFTKIAATVYDTGIEGIAFIDKDKSSTTINNWVEDNTNGKIKNFIQPKDIEDLSKAILVNALYFSGKWMSPFQDHLTDKKKFFKTKYDHVDVDTMCRTGYYKYYENSTLNAKFLELPYLGADIKMVIILPNEEEGLKRLEQNIEELLATQPLIKEKVNVELPRFSIETRIKLINVLWRVGIHKLFEFADLTGIASNFKNLYVSNVIQKTFINVTESGTEAAAATAVVGSEKSAQDPDTVIFHANHPFIYFIKANGVILFIGRYTAPGLQMNILSLNVK